jgi:hypothetical protein
MSYREENGQVTLTMSREDYGRLLMMLGMGTGLMLRESRTLGNVPMSARDLEKRRDDFLDLAKTLEFMNRLNQGNPDYTPYQVEAKRE